MKTARVVGAATAALAAASLCACAPGFGLPSEEDIREDVTTALAEEGYTVTSVFVSLDGFGHDLKINLDGGDSYTSADLRTIMVTADDIGAGKFAATSYSFRDESTDEYLDVCEEFEQLEAGGFCRNTGFLASDDLVARLRDQS